MSRRKFQFFLVFTFAVFQSEGQRLKVGNPCTRKHDNLSGICKLSRDCPKVKEEYDLGIIPTYCGIVNRKPIVCCLKSEKRISLEKCDQYAELTKDNLVISNFGRPPRVSTEQQECAVAKPLIHGGSKTEKGEFPHMAAIGWRLKGSRIFFKCGGTLISEQFVLTAAHCGDEGDPSFVRLGDQNLRNRRDGLQEVDINVAKFTKHEMYDPDFFYYDIAIIKMVRSVEFTKFIRPACLWPTLQENIPVVTASGWGDTENREASDELMKVQLNVFNNTFCNKLVKLRSLPDGIVVSQICAGVLEGGKDTCNGDSGGPIHIVSPNNSCLFYVVGITSVGSWRCGKPNSPALFSRVASYLDWIEEKVWG